MLLRMWRKRNSCTLLWECKLVQPVWKTSWRFLKKLKIELPYDWEIPLWVYVKETKALIQKIHAPQCSEQHYLLFQDMEATYCLSIHEWIKRYSVHNGILLSCKKVNKILPFVKIWINLEGIMWSETSQTENDKYYMLSFISGN